MKNIEWAESVSDTIIKMAEALTEEEFGTEYDTLETVQQRVKFNDKKDEHKKAISNKIEQICEAVNQSFPNMGISTEIREEATKNVLLQLNGGITVPEEIAVDFSVSKAVFEQALDQSKLDISLEDIRTIEEQSSIGTTITTLLEDAVDYATQRNQTSDLDDKVSFSKEEFNMPIFMNPVDEKYAFKDMNDAEQEQRIEEVKYEIRNGWNDLENQLTTLASKLPLEVKEKYAAEDPYWMGKYEIPEIVDKYVKHVKNIVQTTENGLGVDALLRHLSQTSLQIYSDNNKLVQDHMVFFEKESTDKLLEILIANIHQNPEFKPDQYTQVEILNLMTSAMVVDKAKGLSPRMKVLIESLDPKAWKHVNKYPERYMEQQLAKGKDGQLQPFDEMLCDNRDFTKDTSAEGVMKRMDRLAKGLPIEGKIGPLYFAKNFITRTSNRMFKKEDKLKLPPITDIKHMLISEKKNPLIMPERTEEEKRENVRNRMRELYKNRGVDRVMEFANAHINLRKDEQEKKTFLGLAVDVIQEHASNEGQTQEDIAAQKDFFVGMFKQKILDENLLKRIVSIDSNLNSALLSHYAKRSSPENNLMIKNLEQAMQEAKAELTINRTSPTVSQSQEIEDNVPDNSGMEI